MPAAKTSRNFRTRPIIVFIILCGIWGSTWAFIKLGLRDLPPITFLCCRFIIALTLLSLIAYFRRAQLPRTRDEWSLLITTGLLGFTLNYGLVFWGESHISSGLTALLQATIPLFGLIIAHRYLPSESLTLMRLMGVVLGLIGVVVIFSDQMSGGDSLAVLGGVGIVVGALCVAYSNILIKVRGAKFDISVLAAGQMFFGLMPLLVFSFIKEGNPLRIHWTMTAVVSLLYLALVGSVAAFMLYYWLVRNMDVTNTLLISLVTPIVAVLIGVVFLDEVLSWRIAFGGAGILTGISLIVLRRRSRAGDLPETASG